MRTAIRLGLLRADTVKPAGPGLLFFLSKTVHPGFFCCFLSYLFLLFSLLLIWVSTKFVLCVGCPSPAFLYIMATSFLFLTHISELAQHIFQPGCLGHMQHSVAVQSVSQPVRCAFLCSHRPATNRISSVDHGLRRSYKLLVTKCHLNTIFNHQLLYFSYSSGLGNIKINC